ILNWSFAHDAEPQEVIMNQIALALQKEIKALEENGIQIIQVDEPALREGLPLDAANWDAYLEARSEEHTSELQSRFDLVCRLLCHPCIRFFTYTTLFRSRF